ncbi:ATP-binding cassette domain-containing protein [Levilactobacillus namurensis]
MHIDKAALPASVIMSIINAIVPLVIVLGNTAIINAIVRGKLYHAKSMVLIVYSVSIVLYIVSSLMQKISNTRAVKANETLRILIHEAWERVSFQSLVTAEYFSKMMKSESSFRYSGGIVVFCHQIQNLTGGLVTVFGSFGLLIWLTSVGFLSSTLMVISTLTTLSFLLIFEMLLLRVFRHLTNGNITLFARLMVLERKMNYFLMSIINKYEILKSVKTWGTAGLIQKRYLDSWNLEKKTNHQLVWNDYISQIIAALMISNIVVWMFSLVILKIRMGFLPVGQLNTLFGGVVQISAAVATIASTWQRTMRFQNQMAYVNDILKEKRILDSQDDSGEEYPVIREHNIISFDHVSFGYNSGNEVIHNLSFNFELSGISAIIGENGSGKTTLVKLMLGLLRPTKGNIFWNGQNIREIQSDEYFGLFKVVFQDFRIFDVTIGENITASDDYNHEQMKSAIFDQNLKDWISALPNHENSLVGMYGESNLQPSGGQKQQMAIARSNYKNGIYQILDEPSSKLDPIQEVSFFSKVAMLSSKTPSLFITHRIGVVGLAGTIIVLRSGKIVGVGTKKSLLRNSLYFRKIWDSQASLYK